MYMEENLFARSTRSWSIYISNYFTKYWFEKFQCLFRIDLIYLGNIYFNYLQIPNVKISSLNHAHRLGLSDAYLSQHATNEHIVRVITLYDKINLDKDKIKNGLSIVFDMDQSKCFFVKLLQAR